jgi:hypothetical protein
MQGAPTASAVDTAAAIAVARSTEGSNRVNRAKKASTPRSRPTGARGAGGG